MIQQEMVKELSESKLYWPRKRLNSKVPQLCHLCSHFFGNSSCGATNKPTNKQPKVTLIEGNHHLSQLANITTSVVKSPVERSRLIQSPVTLASNLPAIVITSVAKSPVQRPRLVQSPVTLASNFANHCYNISG